MSGEELRPVLDALDDLRERFIRMEDKLYAGLAAHDERIRAVEVDVADVRARNRQRSYLVTTLISSASAIAAAVAAWSAMH